MSQEGTAYPVGWGTGVVGGHQGGKNTFPGELASHIEANTQIVLAKPLAA